MSRPFFPEYFSMLSSASRMSAMSSTRMDAMSGWVRLSSLAIHPRRPLILFPLSIFSVSVRKCWSVLLRCG